ncbi:MAG: energy transducer TonB [Betaproteobacteria bacterium]|nr:energy transducer TonB [Betaproteobacteria bacterium]
MDYAHDQAKPSKHLVGFAVVVLFHILVVWALISGLARTVVDVIKQPLTTKIIEEVKPPPPPDLPPPPPPKMVQMQPTFVPPPEVVVQTPPPPQPVIASVTSVAPPVTAAPRTPVQQVTQAPPAPSNNVGVACPNSQKIRSEIKYPPQAQREGLSGEVVMEFTVAANGEIKDIVTKSSTNRVFERASVAAVRQFQCNGQGQDVRVQVPFSFSLKDQ